MNQLRRNEKPVKKVRRKSSKKNIKKGRVIMRKFEGNINGKIYTDEKNLIRHFYIRDMIYVSYKYVSPDVNDETN